MTDGELYEPDHIAWSVYVLVKCDTEEQAKDVQNAMEEAAGKLNAELLESLIEKQSF